MSNRYWSKWGDLNLAGQTVGFGSEDFGGSYYIRSQGSNIQVNKDEIDDLIYQLMRLKRKVEGE